MPSWNQVNRRDFLNQSLAVAGAAGIASGSVAASPRAEAAMGEDPCPGLTLRPAPRCRAERWDGPRSADFCSEAT